MNQDQSEAVRAATDQLVRHLEQMATVIGVRFVPDPARMARYSNALLASREASELQVTGRSGQPEG